MMACSTVSDQDVDHYRRDAQKEIHVIQGKCKHLCLLIPRLLPHAGYVGCGMVCGDLLAANIKRCSM